jgi:hypothetical protein
VRITVGDSDPAAAVTACGRLIVTLGDKLDPTTRLWPTQEAPWCQQCLRETLGPKP